MGNPRGTATKIRLTRPARAHRVGERCQEGRRPVAKKKDKKKDSKKKDNKKDSKKKKKGKK